MYTVPVILETDIVKPFIFVQLFRWTNTTHQIGCLSPNGIEYNHVTKYLSLHPINFSATYNT